MRKLFLSILICCMCAPALWGAKKYVSSSGSDSNAGTLAAPYASIATALSNISAGDTIYVMSGTYALSAAIKISSKAGADTTHRTCLFAYDLTARPVLNFSGESSGTRGIELSVNNWYIKGLQVCNAGDNGIHITGSYNKIEFCSFFQNLDSGCQIDGGGAYNQIINCDSYYNCDSSQGNADGFSTKMAVGVGNYYYGCRSWQNSDDGWDGYLRGVTYSKTTIINCWSFRNGYLKDGSKSTGNGNGFKMGGEDTKTDSLCHDVTCINCLCFGNLVKGFDQNNDAGNMTWINCTAFNNGTYNFSCPGGIKSTSVLTIENCISYGSGGQNILATNPQVQKTNSWSSGFATISSSMFTSIDTTGVTGARKVDGSLPDITFMHLSSTSQYRNAGTLDPGATSKDLGAFAYATATDVEQQISPSVPAAMRLLPNYPNPFNPSTQITFTVGNREFTTLKVYDVLGRETAALFAGVAEQGKTYSVRFDASHCASGVYFSVLQSGSERITHKMVLMK
jgi:hypothetical protein